MGTDFYVADVSSESLNLTTLGNIAIGKKANLEKALTPTTRLGGHLVSGHVDGIGQVVAIKKDSRSVRYDIQAPSELGRYIAKKGSITVDGISLTVNDIDKNIFKLNLVPHTLQETNAKDYQVGTQVNLEVDLLARYLERLLLGQKDNYDDEQVASIDYQQLVKTGFIK
jgi:riboflavin synthase